MILLLTSVESLVYPMKHIRVNVDDILVKSDYLQESLDKLLSVLQPSFYCLNLIVKILLHGPDGSGKRLLAKTAAQKLNMEFREERISDLFDENIVGTEKKVKSAIAKLATSAPCVIYLTGYELFNRLEEIDLDRIEYSIKESLEELLSDNATQPVVFIGATNDYQQVFSTPLSHIFQHCIEMTSPDLKQAERIIDLIKSEAELQFNPTGLLENCTKGEYYLGNLIDIVAKAEVDHQASGLNHESYPSKESDGKTRWLDIGGLKDVKREIIDAIQLSLDFPQLKKSGLRRTGILLYGPPGTGKTLLARAVATECSLNFINVKGPELLNEYVGQSEDNIRKLFQRAKTTSPSVIFFDELDSLAPNRGQAGDSGGVMDRMVSQILAEMDGIGKGESVFVIGATNRVDLVDPSLLRPGRFDKVLEVPLPVGKENRLEILMALTRKMQLAEDVSLDKIESLARPDMSGADFGGLCSKAIHRAFNRCIELVESGQASEDDVRVVINMEDFIKSLNE